MAEMKLTGSCLCGSVQYEVSGEAKSFYHCHCQRCRKATGTGHASNLFISPATSLNWIKGKALLAEYKVPEAERFYTRFCKNCGSPVPRDAPSINAVIVPAGSLDVAPAIKPNARIFWDSRAEWSCTDEALPMFSEYP